MEQALNKLIDQIVEDYRKYFGDAEENLKLFRNEIEISKGKKYARITQRGSAWGFVVLDDSDKKFKKGDILMAAGWKTPARNQARGNIFEEYSIGWAGPNYLRG
jgi:hypothetical protein